MKKLEFMTFIQDMLTVLDSVEPEHFSLHAWLCINTLEAKKAWLSDSKPSVLKTCGTVACIVGHCALNADFSAKYGIRLSHDMFPVYTQPNSNLQIESWRALNTLVSDTTGMDSTEVFHFTRFLFSEQMYVDPSLSDVKERLGYVLELDADMATLKVPLNQSTSKLVVFDILNRLKESHDM